jgi:hypothetical protein
MSGYRKLIAYFAALSIITWLTLAGALDGGEFAGCFKLALGAFIVGNGAEHGARLFNKPKGG